MIKMFGFFLAIDFSFHSLHFDLVRW
jgi:hypothetical protein